MRVQSEARKRTSLGIEQVEEDEGFQNIAKIRRAHQAGDGPLPLAAGPMDDPTRALFDHYSGFGHDENSLAAKAARHELSLLPVQKSL